uniref:ADAM metallopeptidase domain 22 n=1 Tax=Rousettus aegyptiacus TaxID=9407 RepID=A0A7J8D3M5_ROUAE|nr:ADAM metallopeptidase domain 22 [Rousettus aegyptiacus]
MSEETLPPLLHCQRAMDFMGCSMMGTTPILLSQKKMTPPKRISIFIRFTNPDCLNFHWMIFHRNSSK